MNANLQTLKSNYNLLAELPDLKQHGRYWIGPCPFCGGKDRFNIRADGRETLWVCRHCSPDGTHGKKYQDVVAYLAMKHNLPLYDASKKRRYEALEEIVKILGGNMESVTTAAPVERPAPQPIAPPEWQETAYEIMQICKRDIPAHVMGYLTGPDRLLTKSQLDCWDIGYSRGFEHNGVWVPRGIVIPCFENGLIWYLKIRLVPGDKNKCVKCKTPFTAPGVCACGTSNKYRGVTGNRPGLFGAGTLAGATTLAIITEGEFDAMHIWTAINRLGRNDVGVITTGASSHYIDPVTWSNSGLLKIQRFICLYDNDEAGEKAYQHTSQISARTTRFRLPVGKDVTEFIQRGGDITAYVKFILGGL
jgi:hypothetical protein